MREYARRTKPTTPTPINEPIGAIPVIPIPPREPRAFSQRQTGPLRPEPHAPNRFVLRRMRRGLTRHQFHARLLAHNRLRASAGFRLQVPPQPSRTWPQAQPPIQSTPGPNRPIAQPGQSRPAQSRPVAPPAPARPVAQTSSSVSQYSSFGFSIPESPSLIARLFAGLRSIGDSLKITRMRAGATGDFQFLLKDEPLLSRIARNNRRVE